MGNSNGGEQPGPFHALDRLRIPFYTTDAAGKIDMYNSAAVELWGREPVKGKDMWCGSFSILHPDGQQLKLNEFPLVRAFQERKPLPEIQLTIVRPDGLYRHVISHPEPIFNNAGELTGGVNFLIDITDLKMQAQKAVETVKNTHSEKNILAQEVIERTRDLVTKNAALDESEERYHKMIEEVEDYAIVLLDSNGIIQNWNRGAEKIKGYKDTEIIGKSFRSFYSIEDQEKKLPDSLLNEARTNGKAIHEGWRMRKDGTRFWGSIVITGLHNTKGEIVGFSKVTRDLTERKEAEEKAAAYTRLLEFQNRELEQFAYAASHDMKEPLRKISFYNNYILEKAHEQLDEKCRTYLDRSINAAVRMSDLIDNLLTYSKANAVGDSFADVDMGKIVDDVILNHRELIDSGELRFERPGLPHIIGIPFQLHQLVDNLVNNSIKYRHPERDIVIRINCSLLKEGETDLPEADGRTEYYQLTFEDNGIGFEEADAEKIFEIFQRVHNPTLYKGSGIGLSICKKIVQNHNGFIRAHGATGIGASFNVYLPKLEGRLPDNLIP